MELRGDGNGGGGASRFGARGAAREVGHWREKWCGGARISFYGHEALWLGAHAEVVAASCGADVAMVWGAGAGRAGRLGWARASVDHGKKGGRSWDAVEELPKRLARLVCLLFVFLFPFPNSILVINRFSNKFALK